MNKLLRNKGFTLIEIMVVIALVSVIAAIAIPAYTDSVNKARRVDAQSSLMGLASAMERYYTVKSSYIGTTNGSDTHGAIPSSAIYASETPLQGGTKYYDLRMTVTATSYVLFAYPKGSQINDGALRLTSTNQRGWDKNNNGTFSESWQ